MSEPAAGRAPREVQWLRPQWQLHPRVCAAFSLRYGGVSTGAYASLNLGAHVGDDPRAVAENRRRLRAALSLPVEPLWLAQQHGTAVVDADADANANANGNADAGSGTATTVDSPAAARAPPPADAALTRRPGRVLAVLVADCLPVLLARTDGSAVAVAHAGWRGLAAGVIEAAVAAVRAGGAGKPAELCAWLGPAISPEHFEVGSEVRAALCAADAEGARALVPNARGRWQCDLYELARQRLERVGVQQVAMTRRCSYRESELFYSYRREGVTGRMAALVWLQQ